MRPVAGIAQLVEHLICNQGVAGSNPAAGTRNLKASQELTEIRVGWQGILGVVLPPRGPAVDDPWTGEKVWIRSINDKP
jgi:hypothetical protein